MGKLLLLFTIVPLVELYLLLRLADVMGLPSTLLLVLVTGLLGAALAKAEGLRVIREWQGALSRGEVPEEGIVGGILVLVGAVLLVTPGVLTDVTGLCLLLPATRRLVARGVRKAMERGVQSGRIHVASVGFPPGAFPHAGSSPGRPSPPRGRTIDREVIEVEARVVEPGSK